MGEIYSVNLVMKQEAKAIENTKEELINSYGNYLSDNEELVADWEGDTATVFAVYSSAMNGMLCDAIGITRAFGMNVDMFKIQSELIDMQAHGNAEGVK